MTAVVKKSLGGRIEYTNPDGTLAGNLKVNSVLSKKAMELHLSDGTEWIVRKSTGLQQIYSVTENDATIAKMDVKALALKPRYSVDIAENVALPLAAGVVWAINFAHLRRVAAAGAGAAAAG